ncbi:MAG TPA: hypothetical protein VKU62_08550, partial [Thermoanaerobaculia bacterium]|nr:hypothetical protein [Thermoanaerobaculia bacterium]
MSGRHSAGFTRGARLRHMQPLSPGAESRLIFDWGTSWFSAVTKVLSTRFVDSGEDTCVYESRLQFVEVPQSNATLEQVVATLRNAQLRKWVGNLMGEALAGALPNDE